MKNLLLLTFLVLSFVSCKDDTGEIIGDWTLIEIIENEVSGGQIPCFWKKGHELTITKNSLIHPLTNLEYDYQIQELNGSNIIVLLDADGIFSIRFSTIEKVNKRKLHLSINEYCEYKFEKN